jgi:phosphonoacetate hydrolase
MESARFVQMPTVFEHTRRVGWRTALVTAKIKLLELLGRGADVAFSAERPPPALCTSIGTPASIYSLAVNYWVLSASHEIIRREGPELVYAFTTDYAMHKYSPEDERSQEHLHQLDALLGEILDSVASDVALFVTADHGMSTKSSAVDLEKWLSSQGIAATVVSTIRDQYTVHHRNLSGSAYVYCTRTSDVPQAAELLRAHPAVEEVWPRAEAAAAFHLLPECIGDLMVLARPNALFGELTEMESEVALRSHGSRHESQVPLIGSRTLAYHPYQYNLDVTRAIRQFFL